MFRRYPQQPREILLARWRLLIEFICITMQSLPTNVWLRHAKAYVFLKASPALPFHNPQGIETGEYDDTCDLDERFFAAASLYAATGEPAFLADAQSLLTDDLPVSLGWEDMAGYGCIACLKSSCIASDDEFVSTVKTRLMKEAETLVILSENHPYGISLGETLPWGSNMYLLNNAVLIGEANVLQPSTRYENAVKTASGVYSGVTFR